MAKEQTLYLKTTGANYGDAPENLGWTPDGTVELVECKNAYVNPFGKIERGLGHAVITTVGAVHTLFDKERVFVGVGTFLHELVDGALLQRKANCAGNEIKISVYGGVAYCFDGVSFFTVKADGSIGAWAFTGKKGAVTHRQFSGPIAHTKSRVGYGRIFTLVSGVIFHSEPIGPTMFDYASNVIWDANSIQDFACSKSVMLIGTAKTTYALVGADFKQVERLPLTGLPAIQGSIAVGYADEQEVICFATHDALYVVDQSGKCSKVTGSKIPAKFFTTFTGARITNGRYTLHGPVTSYAIDLETGALEKFTTVYSKISNRYGMFGNDLVELGLGSCVVESDVTFPALSFDTSKEKSFRFLEVCGYFAGVSTWTVSDEFGRTSVKTVPAFGTTGRGGQVKLTISSKVSGQFLMVNFKTNADFILRSIHCTPIIKVSRRG